MKSVIITTLACLLLTNCQSYRVRSSDCKILENKEALRLVSEKYPDIAWDPQSFLKLDINDDGNPDYALMGSKGQSQVSVAVVISTPPQKSKINILNLGVGTIRQDSLAQWPVKLTAESMDYDPSDAVGELSGFKPSKTAQGLRLSDDLTDEIHIFWNHDTHKLEWWRL